jgi:hypothetical protein
MLKKKIYLTLSSVLLNTDENLAIKERNKIILYKNTDYIFVSFAVILNILTGTLQILENVVVETFLLNRICDNFSIQEF